MEAIALSGVDGVGKSQQIELLKLNGAEHFHFTAPLISYDDRWPKQDGSGMAKWWFQDVPIRHFVDIVVTSLKKREQDELSGKVSVHDRSVNMFKAVVAATLLTRDYGDTEQVISYVADQFSVLEGVCAERELLLTPCEEYLRSVANYKDALDSESTLYSTTDEVRYSRYQGHLGAMMKRFVYPLAQQIVVDGPIVDVQNRVRSVVGDMLRFPLPPYLTDDTRIVAFGGLSECGKSSFAEYFNQRGYLRLKQKYFFELSKILHGSYDASKVVLEMLRFLQAHTIKRRFTLESLHEHTIPAMLKLFFGDRANIVFIDVPLDQRVERCAQENLFSLDHARQVVLAKDETKLSRGADKVRSIADHVISNETGSYPSNASALFGFLDKD